PLGLNHLMATGHHYGPGPWVDDLPRADWNPTYFHRADADGIGFDRTASGSNAVSQYAPEVAAGFADLARIDERFLLWFHHLPWDHPMPSGRPLWHELVARYDRGVAATGEMRRTWAGLADHVDARRHSEVADFLAIQEEEARWWRDSSIAYWRSLNGLPMPQGHAPPEHDLAHYERLSFPHSPGHWD
ncbi:MAG: alpha-glucuronidase, partial [Brevundimonas sp.]